MKKYWLFIESYIFFWANESNALFYNTLSGKSSFFHITPIVKEIINQLIDKDNFYCTEITEQQLIQKEISSFINQLRNEFICDLLPQSAFSQKPLVIVPVANVNEDLKLITGNSNDFQFFGKHIANNLHTMTIRLNSECKSQCKYCTSYEKQFNWCSKKANGILPIGRINDILTQLTYSGVTHIQFIGGDITLYPHLKELLLLINNFPFKITFYVNIQHINSLSKFMEYFHLNKLLHICLLTDCNTKEEEIEKSLLWSIEKEQVSYCFPVSSTNDFNYASSMIEKYHLKGSILPFYTHTNQSFFKEYVYQEEEDISGLHRNKKNIFANQQINTHFFGHLQIDCDGKVYSNVNMEPIGDSEEKINELVFKEMKNGKAWFLTRDKVSPCKDSLFRYLCPSPSNYELVIGKPNLCHVKP